MDKVAKAVVGAVTSGGAAFLAAYGARPLPEVIALTLVAAAGGFGLVWGVPNVQPNQEETHAPQG